MKLSFKNITINQFKKLLSTLNNEDFCFFINDLMEVKSTDMILVPIFKSKYGDYQWISYFSEDGEPYDENGREIINEINKHKDNFDYVLINPDNTCTYFKDATFKNDIFNMPIFKELYSNKEMWVDEHYPNGNLCDCYHAIMDDCDISVLF